MKRRQLSKPQPPRSARRDVWDFYLAELGLSVNAGKPPARRGARKPHQHPKPRKLSPLAARTIQIAETRGCTIENARRIADRERTTANAV